MRVHKPKVEYKLALQEKPQGSILTYYDKTNNLTRINWLNTRLIIASNKIRHEIPFKTKRVNTQWFERYLLKQSKKANHAFFLHCAQCFTYPLSFQFYFPPQFPGILKCYFSFFCSDISFFKAIIQDFWDIVDWLWRNKASKSSTVYD